jgi:3-dehydroquinate synthetase
MNADSAAQRPAETPAAGGTVLVAHIRAGLVRLSKVHTDSGGVRVACEALLRADNERDSAASWASLAQEILRDSALEGVVFVRADDEGEDPLASEWVNTVAASSRGLTVRGLGELAAVANAFAHRVGGALILCFGETLREAGFVPKAGTLQALSRVPSEWTGSHLGSRDFSAVGLGRHVSEALAELGETRGSRLAEVMDGRGETVSYRTVCETIELYGDVVARRILEEFLEPLAIHLRRQCRQWGIAHVVITGDLVAEHLACIRSVLAAKNAPFGECEYTAVELERAVAIGAAFFVDRERHHPAVLLEKTAGEPVLRLLASRPLEYTVHQSRVPCFSAECDALPRVVMNRPVFAIVDRNVERIYGSQVRAYLRERVNLAGYLDLPVCEKEKDLATVERICGKAKELGVPRHGVFVGIGGGVLLDIVGFAASMFRRGVAYVRVPTTLVGLVDVGMGIKQGVNFGHSKNLLGSFYPPLATINDRTFMRTLGTREIRCGFAEIVKMALIRDAELFAALEKDGAELVESKFERPREAAERVMTAASKDMMEELQPNLFEQDLERLVDFGHTFSPAIELHTDYEVAHGEAVAMDVYLSCLLAVDRREFSAYDLNRVQSLYRRAGLETWAACCPSEVELYDGLRDVKWHRGGALNLVVPSTVGKGVFLHDVTYREIAMAVGIARNESERAGSDSGAGV